MITSNSRYAQSQIVVNTDLDGNDILVTTPSRPVNYTIQFTYYQVKANDRIDLLAYQFYGDSSRWWLIADANPEVMDWARMGEEVISETPSTPAPVVGYLLRVPTP